jgi:2'-5' RNA ligase
VPRLFAALPVPGAFAREAAALPRKGIDASWSAAADLHLTLRFLGEVPEESCAQVEEALARVRRPPFAVEIEGLGFFAKTGGAVLYAAVASTRKLTVLAADINAALAPLGFEMPRIPYVPHVTLARLAAARGLDPYIRRNGACLRGRWQAEGFALMQSGAPGPAGRYRGVRFFDFPEYI